MLWNDVLFASVLAAAPLDPSITVTGRGTAEASPDQARITVAVETEAETARKALDANNQRAAQLVAALEELKIPRRMIQTSQLSLHPVYGTEATPRITGYRAFNQVVVE